MPVITLTMGDISRSKILETGWYKATVKKVHPAEASKDGASVNYKISFLIHNKVAEGKEIDRYYNSKAMGMITSLLEASGIKVEPGNIEIDLLEGKELDVKIGTKTFEGQLSNEITEFLPLGKGTSGPGF